MLNRCFGLVAVISALTRSKVTALRGGSCHAPYNVNTEKSYSCEDGYYCCNIYANECCLEVGSNAFYDWILVFSSIAVLIFVIVMSCYWCSCCPAYKRRIQHRAAPCTAHSTQPAGHRTYPRQEQLQQGAPYLIQSGSNSDQMPPFPQLSPGEQDRDDFTLVPPYCEQPSAPPYSLLPLPSHRQSVPPYHQPSGDIYVPLAPPVYPDEPPPRYTP